MGGSRSQMCIRDRHTTVETLDEEAKIREISRLLDGDAESEITAVHARELVAKFRTN